jgi:4-amino-4-deoxy-L-arabinose transferase-like glycosyltransferase
VSYLAPIALAAAAIALIVASTIQYEPLKAYMDSFASDGEAETFSPRLYASLVLSIRVFSVLVVGVAALLFRARRRIASLAGAIGGDTIDYAGDTIRAAVDALRRESAAHLAAAAALIALGIALRIRVLWQPINYDESFTYIVYASRPWLIAWSNYTEPNNHLFHTLLAHLATGAFGDAVWAIRLPALVAGCLAMPLCYALARRCAGRREALVALTLSAVMQIMIAFSVCARGYTMIIDLFVVALLCGADLIAARSPRPWPLFVAVSAAGFFTIPVFLYPFGALMAWLFVAGRRDRSNAALRPSMLVRYGAWTVALVAVCYAPAIAATGLGSGPSYFTGERSTFAFLRHLPTLWSWTWQDLMRGIPPALLLVIAAAALGGIARLWQTSVGWMLLVPLVAWPSAIIPIERSLAPARVWTYVMPLVFMYAAAGAVSAADWIAARTAHRAKHVSMATAGAFALAILAAAYVHLPSHYTEWPNDNEILGHTDLDQVAQYLKTTLTRDDALVVAFPLDFPLEYYMRIHGVSLAPFKRPPQHPERLIVLANEPAGFTAAAVLSTKGFHRTTSPKLLRTFVYSSVYEAEPSSGDQ